MGRRGGCVPPVVCWGVCEREFFGDGGVGVAGQGRNTVSRLFRKPFSEDAGHTSGTILLADAFLWRSVISGRVLVSVPRSSLRWYCAKTSALRPLLESAGQVPHATGRCGAGRVRGAGGSGEDSCRETPSWEPLDADVGLTVASFVTEALSADKKEQCRESAGSLIHSNSAPSFNSSRWTSEGVCPTIQCRMGAALVQDHTPKTLRQRAPAV
jgi:hypothetical protein